MINIKPLSINKAWQGRRFKTKEYKVYETELSALLPSLNVPNDKIKIEVTFYFKNSLSDIDNPLKPFLDILQKKYGFNDRNIYELNVKKEIGEDGIEFNIYQL